MQGASTATTTAAKAGWARDAAIVLVLAAVVAGVGLGRVELIDPDEGRSALVARVMVENGDWLAPHLPAEFHHDYQSYPVEGDQFAYWDKPPLYFWLAAAAMKVLGPTALAARLPSGLALIGTALLAWAAGRALGGRRAGKWAGVVTATAPLVVVMGHTARMDALFVMLLTAGLLAGIKLLQERPGSLAWTLILYVCVGLGVLAKGPVAVALVAGAMGLTLVLCGRWREIWQLRPVTGAIILLAIAAPWFIYMDWRYPATAGQAGFTHVFFVEQHLHRATTGEYGHAASFPGYLLAILLAGLVPWTIFLPGVVGKLAGRGWRQRRENPALLLVLIWAALVVVGFSLSSTQLPFYVAPAPPAVAILLGVYLAERTRGEDMDRLFVVGLWIATGLVGFLGFALLAGRVYFTWLVYSERNIFLSWSDFGIPDVFLLGAALIMALMIRGKQRLFPVALLAGVTALTLVAGFWLDLFDIYGHKSTYDECAAISKQIRPGDQVLAYPYTPYSTAWYLWPRQVMHPTADGTEEGKPTMEGLYAQIAKGNGQTFCMIQKKKVAKEMMDHFGERAMAIQAKEEGRKSPDHSLVVVAPARP